jgi:hypothetical protein
MQFPLIEHRADFDRIFAVQTMQKKRKKTCAELNLEVSGILMKTVAASMKIKLWIVPSVANLRSYLMPGKD